MEFLDAQSFTATSNIVLYAVWKINQYTITFDFDNGVEQSVYIQDYGTIIIAPLAPEKEGASFIGWDKEIPETMPAYDMLITALWENVTINGQQESDVDTGDVQSEEPAPTTEPETDNAIFCTKDNFLDIVTNLIKDSTIAITGELTNDDITFVSSALTSAEYSVILDLSRVTGLQTLPPEAFKHCSKLIELIIPASVEEIIYFYFIDYHDYNFPRICLMFEGCNTLTKIIVDEANPYYSSKDGVLFNKDKTRLIYYPAGKTDEIYTVPDSVEIIEDYAFYACNNLKSVIVSNNVNTISFRSFYKCGSLEQIYLGKSLRDINTLPTGYSIPYRLADNAIQDFMGQFYYRKFEECSKLSEIDINEDNEFYSSSEGVLFNKDKTSIICYPLGKIAATYIIPDSVNTIGELAFYGCRYFEKIIIPRNVNFIDIYAFGGCVDTVFDYEGGQTLWQVRSYETDVDIWGPCATLDKLIGVGGLICTSEFVFFNFSVISPKLSYGECNDFTRVLSYDPPDVNPLFVSGYAFTDYLSSVPEVNFSYDFDFGRNCEWVYNGKINVINDSVKIMPANGIILRDGGCINLNSKLTLMEYSQLVLEDGCRINMNQASRLIIEENSKLILEEGSKIISKENFQIIIRGEVYLKKHFQLPSNSYTLEENGKIIIMKD